MAGEVELNDLLPGRIVVVGVVDTQRNALLLPPSGRLRNKDAIWEMLANLWRVKRGGWTNANGKLGNRFASPHWPHTRRVKMDGPGGRTLFQASSVRPR